MWRRSSPSRFMKYVYLFVLGAVLVGFGKSLLKAQSFEESLELLKSFLILVLVLAIRLR
ncbi:hypothetical protein [Halocatena halophila]|uniref:hypothetical protein n=1 Tax=Halocatena halophila TaxID=2814576 RepID=UPI002ED283E7